MTSGDAWSHVLALAEEQWGLVTKQQIESTGIAWSTLSRRLRSGVLERVAHGVYRLRGGTPAEHLELRAAWLQLEPGTTAWTRTIEAGVVSHRSAALVYGIGHLPADIHEFTLPTRRQTRRADVRLHRRLVSSGEVNTRQGLPVTRPARVAADLLAAREDPGAVGQLVADALRGVYDYPATVADAIGPHAGVLGFPDGDGLALLGWLLDLSGDPDRETWLAEAGA